MSTLLSALARCDTRLDVLASARIATRFQTVQPDVPNLSRCVSQVLLDVTVVHEGYRAESGAVYASAQEVRG